MDPHKVNKVVSWKTPMNKDLLRSFIGAVGFLAPNCKGVQVPMGHLLSQIHLLISKISHICQKIRDIKRR